MAHHRRRKGVPYHSIDRTTSITHWVSDSRNETDLLDQLPLERHEDGSVKFWDVTNGSMPLIYQLKTSDYFQIEQAPDEEADDESWPPFRKVGCHCPRMNLNPVLHFQTGLFDPYCDDPRLAIQKLALCTDTETLVVAGTAGQILTLQLASSPIDVHLEVRTILFTRMLAEHHRSLLGDQREPTREPCEFCLERS